VHDAAHAGARVGAHGDDVSAVPHGDEAIRDGVGRLEQAFQLGDDPTSAIANGTAELADPGTGLIGDAAVVVEGSTQGIPELGGAGEGVGQAADGGGALVHGTPVGGEARARLEDGGDLDQLDTIEHGARRAGALEDRSDVGNDVEGGWPSDRQRLPGLARRGER
jgi:hypothetical protein